MKRIDRWEMRRTACLLGPVPSQLLGKLGTSGHMKGGRFPMRHPNHLKIYYAPDSLLQLYWHLVSTPSGCSDRAQPSILRSL